MYGFQYIFNSFWKLFDIIEKLHDTQCDGVSSFYASYVVVDFDTNTQVIW